MIRASDNQSATRLYRRIGPEAVRAVARRAGLRSFSVDGDWGAARVTAADQVRFFLAIDRLLPSPRLLPRVGHTRGRADARLASAVLTEGGPSEKYGQGTARGIAERLLGGAARPCELVPIRSLS